LIQGYSCVTGKAQWCKISLLGFHLDQTTIIPPKRHIGGLACANVANDFGVNNKMAIRHAAKK
jgi:hypothetical protein